MEKIIRDSKNGRHNIAHGLNKEYNLDELGDTARKLQVVIEAILLTAVGLPPDFIETKLEENRKYILDQ
jgi:hypothetical protein